jgi:4-hydroxybenzoate polyprenyltransferase
MNFTSQAISRHYIVLDIYSITGMISAFFMMLLMRTFDDLKDIEIDKDLFPERATPRGAVLKSDIQILSIISFIVLLVINILFARKTIIIFGITIIYALLTYKWFFAEKIHRKNVFLTMATHQPLPLMVNFYLIQTSLASGGVYEPFDRNQFVLLVIYSLPITAWETSRKIRSIDKETDYVTFSSIFGARGASFIPLVCLLLTGSFSIYIGFLLKLNYGYFIVAIMLILIVLFYYLRFIIKPINKFNILKNITMVFTTFLFLDMLIHVIMNYNIKIQF